MELAQTLNQAMVETFLVESPAATATQAGFVQDEPEQWDHEQIALLLDRPVNFENIDQAKEFLDLMGMKKGFSQIHHEMLLPMSVQEIWQTFFVDLAPYSTDTALSDGLNVDLKVLQHWAMPGDEDKLKGETVLQTRKSETTIKVGGTKKETWKRKSYLVAKDDYQLIIEEEHSGLDHHKHKMLSRPRWEFYQLKPESTQCVVRVTWRHGKLDKPMTQAWANEQDALRQIATEVDYILDSWIPRSLTALTEYENAQAAAQEVIDRTEHLNTSIENVKSFANHEYLNQQEIIKSDVSEVQQMINMFIAVVLSVLGVVFIAFTATTCVWRGKEKKARQAHAVAQSTQASRAQEGIDF